MKRRWPGHCLLRIVLPVVKAAGNGPGELTASTVPLSGHENPATITGAAVWGAGREMTSLRLCTWEQDRNDSCIVWKANDRCDVMRTTSRLHRTQCFARDKRELRQGNSQARRCRNPQLAPVASSRKAVTGQKMNCRECGWACTILATFRGKAITSTKPGEQPFDAQDRGGWPNSRHE
jgi:hypothetical protein